MSNAHKTAKMRKTPSAPMRRLASDDRLVGRVLDYGSGYGFDASYYCTEKYDPHYSPVMPDGRFETIVCNYVLNVIESPHARLGVLQDIQARLADGGKAYITVRNDKRALIGTTNTGSWQGEIVLALPVVYKCSGFVTYELPKTWTLELSIQAARTH